MKKLWKPALLLAAIAIMVIGTLGSGAWFTDSGSTTAATINSATLSINNSQLSIQPIATIANMAPGDKTAEAVIIIENNGNIDLGWFGNMVISDSVLKDVIYIDSAKMEFLSPAGAANWEPTDNFIVDGLGYTKLGAGTFASLANFDGNGGMAPGTPYEFMGALKPGHQYKLTLKFGFLETAGNEYQTKGPMTIDLQVNATQLTTGALTSFGMAGHLGWMNEQIAKQ